MRPLASRSAMRSAIEPALRLTSGRRALRLAAVALILAGLALLWPLARLAGAQSPPVQSLPAQSQSVPPPAGDAAPRWLIQPQDLTVGDAITLTLSLRHAVGERLVAPRLPREWGPLEITGQDPVRREERAADAVSTLRLQARAFVTGSLATPLLALNLVDQAGASRAVEAPPAVVQLRATLRSGDDLPRDLRPQAALPRRSPWAGRLALAAALAGVALALAGARGLRRLPPPAPPAPAAPVDLRAALRRAMAALDEIDAMGLVAAGRLKTHYALATDTLRAYLAERWGVPALDQTSDELLSALKAAGRPRGAAPYLAPLLQEADLVKFARLSPDAERAAALTARLRELLRHWEGQG